jgi:hypothetical protein
VPVAGESFGAEPDVCLSAADSLPSLGGPHTPCSGDERSELRPIPGLVAAQ